jgi:putative transposase
MATTALLQYKTSIRVICRSFGISESRYRYQPKLATENLAIADWLLRMTAANKCWGFGLCFLYLRNIKGFSWNHKRYYRIYRELELNLRIKPQRRLKRDKPEVVDNTMAINQTWSMDLKSDSLSDGRSVRTFNGDYNREGLAI